MRKSGNRQKHTWSILRGGRVFFLSLSVFTLALVMGYRLYTLQVFESDRYQRIADKQHTVAQFLQGRRGEVYLRDNTEEGVYPLAVNRAYPMVYIAPNHVQDVGAVVSLLSSVLGKERSEIEHKLIDRSDPFEVVEHRISPEQVEAIQKADLEGVFIYSEEYRYYPGDTLASHLIGFVGSNGKRVLGRYGLEASLEDILAGKSGMLRGKKDAGGRRMLHDDENFEVPADGLDIVLSVEHAVQYEAESILKNAVEEYDADGGSIVVMDPHTGKILAMAGDPAFNPNEFSKVEDLSIFINRAVQETYESGSVFKPLTVAMGIDQDKISPSSTYVDTGAVYSGSYTIKNSDEKAYGLQTMTEVLEKSLNTGTVYIEQLLGNKTFAEYVRRFGFGESTDSGFIGESSGNIKNLDYLNREINFFTASFGQGISMTPLQLARAYSVLANGGRLMQPQFIESKIHSDGTVEIVEPKEIRRVIQESTAKQVSEMLYSVVENGHGKNAKVTGYRVGGKTGTAQVASTDKRGYDSGITIGTFAGYAPIDNPQFVVVAKIDNPKTVIWAETVAAPAFQKMMQFLLEYKKIPPTENDQFQQQNK